MTIFYKKAKGDGFYKNAMVFIYLKGFKTRLDTFLETKAMNTFKS